MTFGDNLTRNIVDVGKVGKSQSHSMNMYFSCDKGNNVKFIDECYVVSDVGTSTKIVEGTRKGNTYVIDLNLVPRNNLTCLNAINNKPLLWNKRCGHASMSLLDKLSGKDLHYKKSYI